MRFRLRHQSQDLELAPGELIVGRSASCKLSLDDPLVSRRHAVFLVTSDGVSIDDLASRNGVLVNGERITGPTALAVGDRVLIGGQELILRATGDGLGHETVSTEMLATIETEPSTESMAPAARVEPAGSETDTSTYRRGDAFEMLAGVGEKALAMGRVEEAERLIGTVLADVLEASRKGRNPASAVVDVAARFSARLAAATGKGAWVDYVVDLYQSEGRPCSGAVVEELYTAMRRVNAIDLARFRTYLASLRDRSSSFGPAEKFLLQRLEGLERLAALR
ncbi:MAG: FHA domain-containing protein [Polyangiaceae bacterium]|jgi:hypothetical protein